jgi:signal peptidase I
MDTKNNPRFIGLIIAFMLPGSAHTLSGHWKTGVAWYLSFYGIFCLFTFILSVPIALPCIVFIAIELLWMIYFIHLFVSSYRPTRRLGRGGWIIFLIFVVAINGMIGEPLVSLVKIHIGRISIGIGPCMDPTLKSMPPDITATSALVYRSSNPRRGDIVRFVYRKDDWLWGKRVVGLPGETIDIRPPYVLINGKELLDPPMFTQISSCEGGYSGYVNAKDMALEGIELPFTLGPDEYFLLGDNSPESWDSRHFGPFPRKAIVGKVTRIVFPPWRIQEL